MIKKIVLDGALYRPPVTGGLDEALDLELQRVLSILLSSYPDYTFCPKTPITIYTYTEDGTSWGQPMPLLSSYLSAGRYQILRNILDLLWYACEPHQLYAIQLELTLVLKSDFNDSDSEI